jgi:5-deoxy-glucuronate isomerase
VSSDLLLRAGSWESIGPAGAGWRYLSFRVLRQDPGEESILDTGDEEVCLVVLKGSCEVEFEGARWDLRGRPGVFEGMPWSLYLPPGSSYRVTTETGVELAVAGALADRRHPARMISPDDVRIETRGAGSATRQINHILPPEAPAHRLLVVEVYTPAGNWSSYPPHKHDQDRGEEEARLEEVYYYRTSRAEGFGIQRLYSPGDGLDLTEWVSDGDLLLVPRGYHVAAAGHGFDLYYLNALAGDRRSMAAADDPRMAWIRGTWRDMTPDDRVPMVGGGRR